MDIAYEVAEYLQNAGFGTLNSSIFVDQIPSSVNGLYVESNGGPLHKYTSIEECALDIYVKDTSAQEAKEKLKNIKNLIHRMHNTATSRAYIYSILAIGNIESVDRDLENAKIYKQSYSVTCRDLALIS
jgi:hypothetical protein